jgi:hypothetical protein
MIHILYCIISDIFICGMYGRYGSMEINSQKKERYLIFTLFRILDGCLNYLGACLLLLAMSTFSLQTLLVVS